MELKGKKVVSLEFSGPTYQIEVFDEKKKRSFWTFFQFDESGVLKDAFCSCEEEEVCSHLLLANLKIFNEKNEPLHIRYEKSFWYALAKLLAEKIGYDPLAFKKIKKGVYEVHKDYFFQIEANNQAGEKELLALIEKRKVETPENSLKFSSLNDEEIRRWKEGRASSSLLFELSLWSDLAKQLLFIQVEHLPLKIVLKEENEPYPTWLEIDTKNIHLSLKFQKEDLLQLIPKLSTVKANLKVFRDEEKIEKITYHPEEKTFSITKKTKEIDLSKSYPLDDFLYVKGKGFYSKNGKNLLSGETVYGDDASDLLDDIVEKNLSHLFTESINLKSSPLFYTLFFDEFWNLHITSFLFEKGDLLKKGNAFFKKYAYVHDRGFFHLANVIFDEVEKIVPSQDVSNFVTKYRFFLSEIKGFSTHLASVETDISYEFDEEKKTLNFESQFKGLEEGKDFGEWVYFKDSGFFPKKEGGLKSFYSGLKVPFSKVASFLKNHRDELDVFFISDSPFKKRGLHVGVRSETSIDIRPEHEIYKRFKGHKIHFFGEFVHVEGHGFFELPHSMRLPERYEKEVIIPYSDISNFLENELPKLGPIITTLERPLQKPKTGSFKIDFVEKTEGHFKLHLLFTSELGEVSVHKIYEALHKKRSYLFSPAGLIHLHDDNFEWIKSLNPVGTEFSLSFLEFLKLDAILDFKATEPDLATFRDLREFISTDLPPLLGFKSELRDYQRQGLRWLYFLYQNYLSGLLCDDMGLGKTHQAMALIASILYYKPDSLFLIVAPTSVIYHWQDKLAEFLPNVKVHLFHGSRREKKIPKRGIILTSYGIARIEKEILKKHIFELTIFDEIQVAKNTHSQIHHVLRHLDSKMRLGLTGTPIENNLFELKALFDIVLPNYMPKDKPYKETFVDPIEKEGDQKRKELLRRYVKPFMLRRKKQEVLLELPEKSEDKSYTVLSPEQSQLYRQTLEDKKKIITEVKDSSKEIPYMHVFSILATLKQICNHPALILDDAANYKNYESGKWDLFTELLNEAIESEQKVVVFSQYLNMLDIMKSYIKEKNWEFAEIRGSTIKRKEELDRFKNDPKCLIFLGSLQAAGLGIDLTAASIVILYDRWWNAAKENQAIDRVHRMGQKWRVMVYKLITKDTIEEKIDLMISRKGHLLEDIVTADDQATFKTFTRSELIELLSLQQE